MRLVKRDEFLTLPTGTIFQKHKPYYFEEPMVFHGVQHPPVEGDKPNDFICSRLFNNIEGSTGADFDNDFMHEAAQMAVSPQWRWEFDVTERDGLFGDLGSEMYAVWDKGDVLRLMAHLSNILTRDAYKDEPAPVVTLAPPVR